MKHSPKHPLVLISPMVSSSCSLLFLSLVIGGGLLGGKGGFGSQLKGQAAKKKKIKSTKSCRDLKGRRIRHSENEQGLAEFMKKKRAEDSQLDNIRQQEGTQLHQVNQKQYYHNNQTQLQFKALVDSKAQDITNSVIMGVYKNTYQ